MNKRSMTVSEVNKTFGAGVNLSVFEHTWKPSESLLKTDVTPTLKEIAHHGFTTVRLPIALDSFLNPNSSNIRPELLSKLKEIYFTCYNLKLKLILSYHYGFLNNDNLTQKNINHVSWIWKQVQQHFKGHGYDYLFFELYNEPTLTTENWKNTCEKLVSYLRHEDENRFYIVGGTNYNGLNDLMNLGKLKDNKLIYTFHFYEPYIFTHQGADWTNNKTYMKGFPYPYKKRKMPNMSKEAKGTTVEKDYNKYYYEATKEYINDRINQIANYCQKNNMTLICTEAGVIEFADETSRVNYLRDITQSMYQYNIPVMLWDYDQNFSIKKDSTNLLKPLESWIRKNK
ncbi:MAG: cellulase family glycosylhydrolase [Chitinophagaceae bacterium]|nr:cellulase family glycosylhydrolase [Chitinophagaceae bacterium]